MTAFWGFLIAMFSFWEIGMEWGRWLDLVEQEAKLNVSCSRGQTLWMNAVFSCAYKTSTCCHSSDCVQGRCGKYDIRSCLIWLAETFRREALVDDGCCPLSSTVQCLSVSNMKEQFGDQLNEFSHLPWKCTKSKLWKGHCMQALTWDLLCWPWPLDCGKQMADWDQFAAQWLKDCWEKYKQTKCTANTAFWKANELWWTQGHIDYYTERPAPTGMCGRGDSVMFSQWIFPIWHWGDKDHDLQSLHCTCKTCTCDICEENLCVILASSFFLRIAWRGMRTVY